MNKTVIFITFAVLAALGIVGAVVILLIRPESMGTFTTLLVLVLGLATTAAGTFYGLGKTNEKLDVVTRQTNGTLSALRDENDRLTQQNIELATLVPSPLNRARTRAGAEDDQLAQP